MSVPFWEGLRELPISCAGSLGRDVCVDVLAYYEGIDSLYKKTVLMEDYVLEAGRMWRF